jgi:Rhodopirellula transposase DDE domain
VSVGVDHDTAEFAVNSIRRWWQTLGRARYPGATRLLVTADGGGSNGSRVRLWKRELQRLANEIGLDIVVSHLPPGTSKGTRSSIAYSRSSARTGAPNRWSAIESSSNLLLRQPPAPVRLSDASWRYPKGITVSDAEMAAINITRAEFHGDWNYTISPASNRVLIL